MPTYIKSEQIKYTQGESTELDQWRIRKNWTHQRLAKKLGVTIQTARRWCLGLRMPTLATAFWIEHVTKGQVPVVTWMATQSGKDEYAYYRGRIHPELATDVEEITLSEGPQTPTPT